MSHRELLVALPGRAAPLRGRAARGSSAVPNWQPGDTLALNLDRTLRVVEVRHDDPDANPVRVVEEGMNEGTCPNRRLARRSKRARLIAADPSSSTSDVVSRQATQGRHLQGLQGPLPDSNRRPPPYHGGFGASLAYMLDHSRHTFPANRTVRRTGHASRDVARVVSDVSVLCPRTVYGSDNMASSTLTLPNRARQLRRTQGV